jgi:hypothetical protein
VAQVVLFCVSLVDIFASFRPRPELQQVTQIVYFSLYGVLVVLWTRRLTCHVHGIPVLTIAGHCCACLGLACLLERNLDDDIIYLGFLLCLVACIVWTVAFWLPTVHRKWLEHPTVDSSWVAGKPSASTMCSSMFEWGHGLWTPTDDARNARVPFHASRAAVSITPLLAICLLWAFTSWPHRHFSSTFIPTVFSTAAYW